MGSRLFPEAKVLPTSFSLRPSSPHRSLQCLLLTAPTNTPTTVPTRLGIDLQAPVTETGKIQEYAFFGTCCLEIQSGILDSEKWKGISPISDVILKFQSSDSPNSMHSKCTSDSKYEDECQTPIVQPPSCTTPICNLMEPMRKATGAASSADAIFWDIHSEVLINIEGTKSNHICVGPWGGQNRVRWDDRVYNTINQVIICHGAAVDSIQFEYDKKGTSVWSDKHGGTGGIRTNKVKFDYLDEYLASVSGHVSCVVDFGPILIRSLMFESSQRKYRPFGIQQGTHFSFPLCGAKVVGFHGRSSWNLNSIGFHLKPLVQQYPSNVVPYQQTYAPSPTCVGNIDPAYNSELHIDNLQVAVNSNPAIVRPVNPRHANSNGPWGW